MASGVRFLAPSDGEKLLLQTYTTSGIACPDTAGPSVTLAPGRQVLGKQNTPVRQDIGVPVACCFVPTTKWCIARQQLQRQG